MSEQTAVVVAEPPASLMRPSESVASIIQAREELEQLITQALKRGVDYGNIPGTKNDVLLKPGAEKVCSWFNLGAEYIVLERECDHDRPVEWTKEVWEGAKGSRRKVVKNGTSVGLYRAVVECRLIHRASGVLAASGIASCSTMENKYVDRPRECENTVLKMASKRALVAAVLNFAALSERFAQDMEDFSDQAPAQQQEQREEEKREDPNTAEYRRKAYFVLHHKIGLPMHDGEDKRVNYAVWSAVLGREVDGWSKLTEAEQKKLTLWARAVKDGERKAPDVAKIRAKFVLSASAHDPEGQDGPETAVASLEVQEDAVDAEFVKSDEGYGDDDPFTAEDDPIDPAYADLIAKYNLTPVQLAGQIALARGAGLTAIKSITKWVIDNVEKARAQ